MRDALLICTLYDEFIQLKMVTNKYNLSHKTWVQIQQNQWSIQMRSIFIKQLMHGTSIIVDNMFQKECSDKILFK